MVKRWLWIAVTLVFIGVIGVATTPSNAQSVPLSYGTGIMSKLDSAAPFAFFTFNGSVDDQVTVRVIGVVDGYVPTVSLSSPTGQPLAFNSNDPTMPGAGSARVDVRLPMEGAYNIQVGSLNGVQGQFLIRLDGVKSAPEEWVMLETNAEPTLVTLSPDVQTQRLRLSASADAVQVLTLQSNSAPFSATLHSERGILRGASNAETPFRSEFIIPAGIDEYSVFINGSAINQTPISITLTALGDVPNRASGDAAGAQPPTAVSASNPSGAPAQTAAEVDCQITTGNNGTNLRSGPGTGYAIVTVLDPNTTYQALGRNGSWYALDYDGQTAWVAGSVTFLSENCGNAPYLAPPAPADGSGFASVDDPDPPASSAGDTSSNPNPQPTAVPAQPQPTQAPGGGGNPQPTAVPPTAVPPSPVPPSPVPPTLVPVRPTQSPIVVTVEPTPPDDEILPIEPEEPW